MRRPITHQHRLPPPLDGRRQLVDGALRALAHPHVGDHLVVINRIQLLLQQLLRLGVRLDGVDGRPQDQLLLLAEVEQLAEMPRHLVGGRVDAVGVVGVLLDGETRLAEGVDVAEEGPLAEAETLADLLLVHISVVGEEHQQLQLAHDSRLVHDRVL